MSKTRINARAKFLKTGIGQTLRRMKHYYSYRRADAMQLIDETWPTLSKAEKEAIADDMMVEAKKYDVTFGEYVFHRFRNKTQKQRREYICIMEGAIYCDRLNQPKNKFIFEDKGATYRVFGKYFCRDQVQVMNWTVEETKALKELAEKHTRFIVKPYNGANGIGIRIVDASQDGPFDKLCETLKKELPNGFVAEELIKQCKELSAVNPSSVNTMRVITIRMNDRVEVLPSAWRAGQGGRCVDNGGSGGIFCALDENGVIISTADEQGNSYDIHPDTKHPLVGFQIPRYQEAIALALEMSEIVPDNRYCGWDLALTENGWVLQEANSRGGIVAVQCPLGRGLRTKIDALMLELGLPITKQNW